MKKITLLLCSILCALLTFAQEETQRANPTQKGNVLLEVGSTPFGENTFKQGNSTGLGLLSSDGTTIFSIGAEAGFFISDNTALKIGLGYTDLDATSFFTYKLGIKYYAAGNIPIQIDITGATNEEQDTGFGSFDPPDPFWLGLQLGYAAFVRHNISFEPTLRYNVTLNDQFTQEDILELRFNFVIFF